MKLAPLTLAVSLAIGALPSYAADPTASLDRSFDEYVGAGPIGNSNLDSNTFYWLFESTGVYDGQAVNSWFLIWEPERARVRGSVTFDAPILYMQYLQGDLIATSGFGSPGVVYDYSNVSIGLEALDLAGTSISGATLTLAWNGADPGDHVRVMTAAIPEPQTYALMAAGLAALGWVARRRRRG